MRIALISTCSAATPPAAYGGIERFVATLAGGLGERGHAVTVYATGNSRPPAALRACFACPIWPIDPAAEWRHARYAWNDLRRGGVDVVHCNVPDALDDELMVELPTLATIHHPRIDRLLPRYRGARAQCVALSRDHARRFPELGPPPFVHHGLDVERFPAGDGAGGYVAFLGRIGPEKAPHLAVAAACRAGTPLVVAGPHWPGDPRYDDYYVRAFAPSMERAGGLARWVGECDQARKLALLGGAAALLMPLGWDEPFGLVAVEAMLVGTPVVAFRRGGLPELVDEDVTGFVVDDIDAMARAIARATRLDRRAVRERARQRFAASRMAAEYEALYRSIS